MPQFVHLHNHSHYSLLDGAATIDGLVGAAAENNMPAVALTDHGVMFGAIEFYRKAKKVGVKPIIGSEFYIVTKGSRFDRGVNAQSLVDGRGRGIYHHIVLLAKDEVGYKNLMKLSTLGHTEGFYYKPRIDLELLARYREGVLALSACAGGVVSAHLVNGRYDEAREAAIKYREILGDEFYLEIQNHGIEKEKPVLEGIPRLARELGIRLVGTNDVHYIRREHAVAHNVLLLIPEASALNTTDYRQLRYGTDQIYFKSSAEMVEAFKEYPEAVESTLEIAEKCNLELNLKQNFMPRFPIPADAGTDSLETYLEKIVWERIHSRYPRLTPEIEERVNHELGIIKRMGFSSYFLTVADIINSAQRQGIRVGPGRGSSAGSVISYALGITNIEPLEYGLLFERFLNPERVTMPDIDVDFADDQREKVIDYVRQKYGADSVSQIITFGTLSSRAVLKDVGRVLGVPLNVVESITKQIPVFQGRVTPLAEALETIPELRWLKETTDEKLCDMLDISVVLEGMNRNASMHAAGVVIAPGDISDYVPLYRTPQTEIMTQYNMKDLEEVGLLKMDLLGLRTLTVIENALKLIKERHAVDLDLDKLPMDDARTLELFSKGQTVAVFQFESLGMQDALRKLKPTSIHDLVAMNALYRPGPMEMIEDFITRKHGRQSIDFVHPKLESILGETHGIIVYQEQVMKIASEVAGFTLAKADLMRRAMGKKDKRLMAQLKKEFVEGAVQFGTNRKAAGEIFDLIEKFASYGFNKSHSVAYSIVAYQTAYLKEHYPAEYMAATLTSEIGNTDKIVLLIDACRKMGLNVLAPDVNESAVNFIVTEQGIRFGMSAIKNVGVSAVENIIQARQGGGKFKSTYDFCGRVDLRLVNKKTLESLIQAGAFDSMPGHRAQLFAAVERAMQFGQNSRGLDLVGQSSLFEASQSLLDVFRDPPLPESESWSEYEKLHREKTVLGFYVSGHPLAKYEEEVNAFSTVKFGSPEGLQGGQIVRACGIVTQAKRKVDRKGNKMAFVTLEDFSGKGECIVFSDPYKKYERFLHLDSMVMVIGRGESTGDAVRIIVNEVYPMDRVREKFTKSIILSINLDHVTANAVIELRKLMEKYRGNCFCYFNVLGADHQQMFRTNKFVVDPNDEFITEVKRILGPHSIKLTT